MEKIWVVDSDAVLLEGMNIALSKLNIETCLFSNPFKFLRRLSSGEAPTLIILNLKLAGVDTRDLLRVLRIHPDFAGVPLMVMVDKQCSEEAQTCLLGDGVCEVVCRDMPVREFIAVIQSFLESNAAWTVTTAHTEPQLNLATFHKLKSAQNLERSWFMRIGREMFNSRIDSKAV